MVLIFSDSLRNRKFSLVNVPCGVKVVLCLIFTIKIIFTLLLTYINSFHFTYNLLLLFSCMS